MKLLNAPIHYLGVLNKTLQNHLLDLSLVGSWRFFSGTIPPTSDTAFNTQSVDYVLLREALRGIRFKDLRNVVDIGSGKGRVLAYLARKYPHLQLVGYDLNRDVVIASKRRLARFRNVRIECADVLEVTVARADLYILFNPFDATVLEAFIRRLSALEFQFDIVFINMLDQHLQVITRLRDERLLSFEVRTLDRPCQDIKDKRVARIASLS